MLPCFEHRPSNTFRVGIHDGAGEFRLQMEGPLAGEAVREAESCWQTAASTIGNRPFVVDLRGVSTVDDAGRLLLERMSQAGARISAGGETPHRRSLKDLFAALACFLLTRARGSSTA